MTSCAGPDERQGAFMPTASPERQPRLPVLAAWLALLLLGAAALGWRLQAQQNDYAHPDEAIAVAVIGKVVGQHSLDTNWARTDVQPDFRYNQFNFSAYYLFASALEVMVGDPGHSSVLEHARTGNAVLGALCVLLAGWLGFRLHGVPAGLAAALLVAVCPTLFQDALYARPEPFCSVLTMALLLVGSSGKRAANMAPMAAMGLLLGILVATKITFAMLVPFPLIAMAAIRGGDARAACTVIGYFMALGLGFAAGAPAAVMHPGEYLEGLAHLFNQYGSGHWPHGLHDGSLVERLAYGLSYLHHAIGLPALLAAMIGLGVLLRRPDPMRLLLVAVLLSAVYFLQSRAFFERNLSHALPPLLVMAAIGGSWVAMQLPRRWRAVASGTLALALAAPGFGLTWKLDAIALPKRHLAEEHRIEAELAAAGHLLVDIHADHGLAGQYAKHSCADIAIAVDDYGDRYFAARLKQMTHQGLKVVARTRGPFDGLPASTLQTYHAHNRWYLLPTATSSHCPYRLGALPSPDSVTAAPTPVQLQGSAMLDGDYPVSRSGPWPFPRYATWNGSDANTGEIRLESPPLCGAVHVPVVTGPNLDGINLEVTAIAADGSQATLQQGPPPLPMETWGALRLTPQPGSCPRYRVVLHDNGTGWGQWAGIGQPVAALPH